MPRSILLTPESYNRFDAAASRPSPPRRGDRTEPARPRLRWGTATADWPEDPDHPNRVTLTPCAFDGTAYPGVRDVRCHLVTPADSAQGLGRPAIAEGDRLAYLPYWEPDEEGEWQPRGVLVNAPQADRVRTGKVKSDFTSGTTVDLDPCDIAGADTGEDDVTGVYVQADETSLDLQSVTINGSTRTPDCKLAADTVVRFAQAADGGYHLVGQPTLCIEDWIVNTSTPGFEVKVRWRWGSFASTLSSAVALHTGNTCP